MTNDNDLLNQIAGYYSAKIKEFGPVAKGVDWKDEASQRLRFDILSRIFDGSGNPSVVQIGCGYGAFVDYCDLKGLPIEYEGYDVSEAMIACARSRFSGRAGVAFHTGSRPAAAKEFAIASGIFNVRMDIPVAQWREHVDKTIDALACSATRGFAFNCLTGFSDPGFMQQRLFYPMPGEMLDYCLGRFGRKVALIHDYDLYEFTVLIRK